MKDGVKYNIDAIKDNGEPSEPKKNADKFVCQGGVFVKDQLRISIQEWKKPVKPRPDLTIVDDRAKKLLREALISHFTLPDHFTAEDVEKVNNTALRKMAVAFNNHKKTIWGTSKEERRLQNSREHWRSKEITV